MNKVIGVILTPIFYILVGIFYLIFDPIQVISFKLGGYSAHKKSVDVLNFCLMNSLRVLGSSIKISMVEGLPTDRPIVVVSNHQSSFDISPLMWSFRKHHPRFISKIELGKNIPSVSYNLRKSGSALIDRKNGIQSIKEIIRLGRLIEKTNASACLFPEGTRSYTGELGKFQEGGFKTLLKASPSAVVVPFVIDGNYKLHLNGKFPLRVGVKLNFIALDPIYRDGLSPEEVLAKAESAIREKLTEIRK